MHYAFRTVLNKRSDEANANEGFGLPSTASLGTFRGERMNGFNLSGRAFSARIRNQIEIEIEIRARIECIMRVDKLPAIYCAIVALRIPYTKFRIPYSVFRFRFRFHWFSQLPQLSAMAAVQLMRFN